MERETRQDKRMFEFQNRFLAICFWIVGETFLGKMQEKVVLPNVYFVLTGQIKGETSHFSFLSIEAKWIRLSHNLSNFKRKAENHFFYRSSM